MNQKKKGGENKTMRAKEEIEKKIEEAKHLRDSANYDYWQGFLDALDWIMEKHIKINNIYVYGSMNKSGINL